MNWEKDDSREYQKWLREHSGRVRKNGSPHWEPRKLTERQHRRIEREQVLKEQQENEARKQRPLLEQQEEQKRQAESERQYMRHVKSLEYQAFRGMVRRFNESECAYILPTKDGQYRLHVGYGGLESLEKYEFKNLYNEITTTVFLHLDSADIPLNNIGIIRCFDSIVIIEKVDAHTYRTTWLYKTTIFVDSLAENTPCIGWHIPIKRQKVLGMDTYSIDNGKIRMLENTEVNNA